MNRVSLFDAAAMLRDIAGAPERPIKASIHRAAERVSRFWPMSPGRAEDIWRSEYGVRLREEEMEAIRLARADRRQKEEAGRAAATELAALYIGVAERLRQIDEDSFKPDIAQLERRAREFGYQAGA